LPQDSIEINHKNSCHLGLALVDDGTVLAQQSSSSSTPHQTAIKPPLQIYPPLLIPNLKPTQATMNFLLLTLKETVPFPVLRRTVGF
jgi:hypothetical protein